MKKVKFTSDFAVKRIGDVIECDGQQASHLVNIDKVAEYTDEEVTDVVSDREYLAVSSEVGTKKFEIVVEQESKEAPEEVSEETNQDEEVTDVVSDGIVSQEEVQEEVIEPKKAKK